jgi:hypothetical protein
MPGVVYAKLLVHEGDAVTCSADGLPTWMGQLMCDAATPEEAIALVRQPWQHSDQHQRSRAVSVHAFGICIVQSSNA